MNIQTIKYLILVLTITIGLSMLVDRIIFFSFNKISDQVFTGQAIGKLNHFLKVKNDVDVLVFGSSRANRNINPDKFDTLTFNMGVDGRKIMYSSSLIRTLGDENQKIILHIDPEFATNENYIGEDVIVLRSKYNRNEIIKKSINDVTLKNPFQDFLYCISYNNVTLGVLKNYFKPKYDISKYDGFDPIFSKQVNKSNLSKRISKMRASTMCKDEIAINIIYLNELIKIKKFCAVNNKELIVVSSPKYFDNCKNDNIYLQNFLKSLDIEFIDMNDLLLESNSLEYWKDEIHLTKQGADLFSEKLSQLLFDK